MTDDRLTHLHEVAPALWPTPHAITVGAAVPNDDRRVAVGEYLLLPSPRRPRLLVPTGRRTAAAVVRHHGEGQRPSARVKAAALAWGLRTGLGPLVWRSRLRISAPVGGSSPTLVAHLGEVLGRDVVMGMHLGAARANRKPVLQLVTPDGRTLAYAKLGVDPLTDALINREATALADLAAVDTGVVEVPALLHRGTWQGHCLLVQSALPVWSPRRPLTGERLVAAVEAVAAIGRTDNVPLARSAFWGQLAERLDALPTGPSADRLRHLVDRIGRTAGDVPLSLGASHGDWTPWNMASLADRLLVWDWERFRLGVPVGFDLLHHRLQDDLVARMAEPGEAAHSAIRGASDWLRPMGLAPRAALLTASLYAADLATRYLTDRQQEAGARLGDVGAWLLPALDSGTKDLEGDTWT